MGGYLTVSDDNGFVDICVTTRDGLECAVERLAPRPSDNRPDTLAKHICGITIIQPSKPKVSVERKCSQLGDIG